MVKSTRDGGVRCLGEYSILPSRGAFRQYRSVGENGKLKDALDDVMVAKYITILFVCFRFSSEMRTGEGWARRRQQQQRASGRTQNRSDCRADEPANRSDCRSGLSSEPNEQAKQECRLLVRNEKTFRFTFCSDNIKLYAFTIHKFDAVMEINN